MSFEEQLKAELKERLFKEKPKLESFYPLLQRLVELKMRLDHENLAMVISDLRRYPIPSILKRLLQMHSQGTNPILLRNIYQNYMFTSQFRFFDLFIHYLTYHMLIRLPFLQQNGKVHEESTFDLVDLYAEFLEIDLNQELKNSG